ncbi:MAG TPA: hypothetical protein VKF15_03410 [Nitrososphaerales archaeon]|nr:hypothetical protein [Nitrososphaerales archaeon]
MTAAVSTVASLYVFLALSLSLSLAACASLLLFLRSQPKGTDVQAVPEVLRMLKNESAPLSLGSWPRAARWCTLASASLPRMNGLSLKADEDGRDGRFIVTASHAGRYEGLEVSATFVDALGAFKKDVAIKPARFVAEVLPLSLLLPPQRVTVTAAAWGELPAGVRGSGQEFYGQEDYGYSTESKDILWKRVSREPEPRLVARVREANVPHSLRVALVSSARGDRTLWMDAVSETLGRVGGSLLALGMGMETTVATLDGDVSFAASTLDELAELVIQIWRAPGVPGAVGDSVAAADLMLVGSGALSSRAVFELSDRKPTLVVPDGGGVFSMGGWARLVSEEGDLESFLSGVIVR